VRLYELAVHPVAAATQGESHFTPSQTP